jgi:hypothetical protein
MTSRGLVVAAIALGIAGCSSTSSNSSTSSSSPGSDGSTACNDLVDDAAAVEGTEVAASAPVASGGSIADGTYVLTAVTAFTGPGGATGDTGVMASAVLVIAGTTMQQVGRINGQESRYTTTITTSGTRVSTMDTCPAPMADAHPYTATSTELRIYDSSSDVTVEQKYARR